MDGKCYTVKQLAELADVTPRTLHHYDQIGLLKPAKVGENNYRYYDESSLFRLQQILFYREMGMNLEQIKKMLKGKDFDLVSALQTHRMRLQTEKHRLERLIKTVDASILHLVGEVKMSEKKIFEGFDKQQEEYEKQAVENWGEGAKESIKLWNSYSQAEQQRIMAEGGQVYQDIIALMPNGPQSAEVQAALGRWHQHLRHFYEPTFDILRGLGNGYKEHPDFNATFTAMHPDLPAFLREAINHYVDTLETEWLEKELGVLKEQE
jgi:DNA-binding transcriptional MerR regulator